MHGRSNTTNPFLNTSVSASLRKVLLKSNTLTYRSSETTQHLKCQVIIEAESIAALHF